MKKLKIIALLSILMMVSGCVSIKGTARLSSQTSNKSISLIEALEMDGHYDLANKIADQEEILADVCEKTNDVIIEKLENGHNSIATFFHYLFGLLNLSDCQKASRDMKKMIDDIVQQYPQYAAYTIVLPPIPRMEDPNNAKQ
jgi:hypothetical protein